MSAWIQNHPENAAAMNTKVSNLETAISNLQKADSVTTFGGKTGAITLKSNSTTNGAVNFAMNNNELTGPGPWSFQHMFVSLFHWSLFLL